MPDAYLRFGHCTACRSTPRGRLHCHKCKTDKPLREFYRDRKRGPGYYHAGCKACRRRQSAGYGRATYAPRRSAA
jgi:hypothetical protein